MADTVSPASDLVGSTGPRRLRTWVAALVAVCLAAAVPVFVRLTSASASSDIMNHAGLAKKIVEGGQWLSYSLWYPVIYVFSLGGTSTTAARLSSIALLTGLVLLKCLIAFWLVRRIGYSDRTSFGIAAALAVVMPLIDPARPTSIYLGQITPTVWHNSTNILAAPFALAAFAAALHLMRTLTIRNAVLFGGLVALSVLAKPNFSLAFLPVAGILLLVILARQRHRVRESLAIVALGFVPATLVLGYQYLAVYNSSVVTLTIPGLSPFTVWSAFSPNIPLSILLSVAGPLLVLIALPRARRRSLPVIASWATLVLAVVELAMLGEIREDGSVALSGNWFWGGYTAMMVVFVVSFIEIARLWRDESDGRTHRALIILATVGLIAHVVAGVYYVLNIGIGDYPSY